MSGSLSLIAPTEIPAAPNLLVPGDYIQVVPGYSDVGILPIPARNLLIGQMTGAGTGTPLQVYSNVTDPTVVRGLAGPGSMADRIATAHLAANPVPPVDVILVADASGSAKAAWTRTFAAAVTANDQYAINICGTRVTFGSLAGDSASTQAADLVAAVNAAQTLPVTAAQGSGGSAGVVTVTAKNAGAEANAFQFIESPAPGDVLPPGMTASNWTQTVTGATNPSVSSVIPLLAGWWTDILLPWSDSANAVALETEAERRFTAMVREDTRLHVGQSATLSAALAWANTVNGKFTFDSPANGWQSEPYVVAAVAMAVASSSLLNDPSQQLLGQSLPGVTGPVYANRWTDEPTQQSLLAGGCSTYTLDRHGVPAFQRYVSTYTENAQGALDPAWRDIMAAAVATRIRYDWRAYRDMVWGGSKLTEDASPAAQMSAVSTSSGTVGARICTPSRMKASWAARRQLYVNAGWVKDYPADLANTKFRIDPNDPNRLDEEIHYTRIGNLMIDSGVMVFEVEG